MTINELEQKFRDLLFQGINNGMSEEDILAALELVMYAARELIAEMREQDE